MAPMPHAVGPSAARLLGSPGGDLRLRAHAPQVWCEHQILLQLKSEKLSFQAPKALPSLTTGATHMTLSNGTEACVFEVIPGTLAVSKLGAVLCSLGKGLFVAWAWSFYLSRGVLGPYPHPPTHPSTPCMHM